MLRPHLLACTLALLALAFLSPLAFNPGGLIPITLQSLVIVGVGIALGAGWGGLVIAMYLLLGGLGAPVFAEGSSGWEKFMGPSGGFLMGFLFSGMIVGWLADNFRTQSFMSLFGLFLLGHFIILLFGFLYLINFQTWSEILTQTFPALLPGLLVKSILGAGILFVLGRYVVAPRQVLTN